MAGGGAGVGGGAGAGRSRSHPVTCASSLRAQQSAAQRSAALEPSRLTLSSLAEIQSRSRRGSGKIGSLRTSNFVPRPGPQSGVQVCKTTSERQATCRVTGRRHRCTFEGGADIWWCSCLLVRRSWKIRNGEGEDSCWQSLVAVSDSFKVAELPGWNEKGSR